MTDTLNTNQEPSTPLVSALARVHIIQPALLPMDTPLAYALEHSLTYGGGMELVPFRTWLALRLINRAYHRRFSGRVVGDFLRYLRRRVAAYAAPLEVPTATFLGGSCIQSIIEGDAMETYDSFPVHLVVHPPHIVHQGAALAGWTMYRPGGSVEVARFIPADDRKVRILYVPDNVNLVEYTVDLYMWSYGAGSLRVSPDGRAAEPALFCAEAGGARTAAPFETRAPTASRDEQRIGCHC